MIAYLSGTIHKKLNQSIILLAGDVGYEVFMPQNTLFELNENDTLEAFIHTAVKEDDIKLYGFLALEELQMFKLLITVSGVGPKSALEILNNQVDSIKYTISQEDIALLVNTPGIGKKTAERIIIDLKSKIEKIDKPDNLKLSIQIDQDAFIALNNLGYQRQTIKRVLQNKPEEINDTEDIIRYFLQNV